jgi:hypothetical protein
MVFTKDGTPLVGPIAFAGTGGLFNDSGNVTPTPGLDKCDDHNRGDPVVLYDELADRWVIGQFAFDVNGSNVPQAPFKQCVAVSTTGDPTGAWALYEFQLSTDAAMFPDYPKLGVWHDAYYLSANAFNLTQNPATAAGGFAIALERNVMLAGNPSPQMVAVSPPSPQSAQLFGLLPADVDGAVSTGPGLFLVLEDTDFGAPTDGLQLWEAAVDWNTSSLVLSPAPFLRVAPFDSRLCNLSRNCIPQPATDVRLDPLSGQLLHRLAYRNFGGRQVLVTTHVADASGTDHAGMRWYELQNTGSGWGVTQTSTFAPDADNRWMGSIAVDASGNIGLGYSTSSATTFPSINYSGRYATDPPSILTQGEGTLIAGGGSQVSTTSRWGDYSTLSVDPIDGCTFWYTNLYYPAPLNGIQSTALWHTRIGSFSLLSDPALTSSSHSPSVWSSNPAVNVDLSGANAGCGVAGFSAQWSTDAAAPADETIDLPTATTSLPTQVLAEGPEHFVRVRTVDAQGNAGDGSVLGPFRIDTTSPTKPKIDAEKVDSFQTSRRFPVVWSANDPLSGVDTYDVRFRRATASSSFGSRKSFRSNTSKKKGSFAGRSGSTYCFSARADDVAGNGSSYGKERCTAGWKKLGKRNAYRRTALLTTRLGAELFMRKVRARSLAVIATRCGRCGDVEVRHRERIMGVIDLSAKPYGAGLVNELPSVKRVRSGRVTLKVVSSGRRVVIDGLGINRVRVTS